MANSGRPTAGPVGYGAKGNAFKSVKAFNASKAGHAAPMHGVKGKAFKSVKAFNASNAGQNKALAGKRRMITIAQNQPQPIHSAGQVAHFKTAEVSKATPVPKMVGGANPVMMARGVK